MQPLRLLAELRNTYRSYVDSFQFYKNPTIHKWVQQSREEGRLLWREPFISIAKPFASGRSLSSFVQAGQLDSSVLSVFRQSIDDPASPPVDLYQHQAEAIDIQTQGRNVVVATGTGSGKSFAFFIPVVSEVLRAKASGKGGVKALLIYPMNALANSQYLELARRLHGTGMTVCNYTSDLRDDREAALRDFFELTGRDEPYDSEVIDRVTLRGDSEKGEQGIPDILITNFKMLEYALVRFRDQQIFPFPEGEKPSLAYLVLDEVHVYSGRQGADMACLVRRFKERTGTAGNLRCVATSATIESGDHETAAEAAARFASSLFGESFEPADVVTASYGPPVTAEPDSSDSFLPAGYVAAEAYEEALASPTDEGTIQALSKSLLDVDSGDGGVSDLAIRHRGLGWLERELARGVRSMDELVAGYRDAFRPDSSRADVEREVQSLLLIASAAKIPSERGSVGVMTSKIHTFFSQGSPVVKCARPNVVHLSDTGSNACVACQEEGLDVLAFPLVFCAACGQEFYVSNLQDDRQIPRDFRALPEDGLPVYVMPDEWDQDDVPLPEDWMAARAPAPDTKVICGQCGAVGGNCGHDDERFLGTLVTEPFLFCPSCGVTYDKRTSEWNKFFQVGSVGRATATDVLVGRMVGGGSTRDEQKVIAFTDNRQDSSFQAAHLNALSRRMHLRRAIWEALVNRSGPGTLADVASETYDAMERANALPAVSQNGHGPLFGPAAGTQEQRYRRYLQFGVALEISGRSLKSQPSLEGSGLLQVLYPDLAAIASWARGEARFPGFMGMPRSVQADVFRAVLDVARRERAFTGVSASGVAQGFVNPDRFRSDVVEQLAPEALFHSGDELPRRPTVLSDYVDTQYRFAVRRVAGKEGSPSTSALLRWVRDTVLPAGPRDERQEHAQEALRDVVRILADDAVGLLLKGVQERTWMLNLDQLLVGVAPPDLIAQRCPRCGARYEFGDAVTHCPKCVKVELRDDPERLDYFREEYRAGLAERPLILAAEHSGQVKGDDRKRAEQQFESPDSLLNVLCCTPTMELGIDIGALSAVYMRNVPPTPANYAQRQGRAGRAGQASIVTTFCGSQGQRGPHDQYFFRFPEKIIAGRISAPRILLDNQLLLEAHINAMVLGFLSRTKALPSKPEEFVQLRSANGPAIVPEFSAEWASRLGHHQSDLVAGAERAFAEEIDSSNVPDDLAEQVVDGFLDSFESLWASFRADYSGLQEEAAEINAQLTGAASGPMTTRDQRTMQRRYAALVDTLSRMREGKDDFYPLAYMAQMGFLPNYAFPRRATVLSLESDGRQEFIARGRTVALREFAPNNYVYFKGERHSIQHAKLRAGAVSHRPYRFCGGIDPESGCGAFVTDGEAGASSCPSCGRDLAAAPGWRLLEMPDMYARRGERVGADTEERLRQGYQIDAFYRLRPGMTSVDLESSGPDARFLFARQARILQVNRGLRGSDTPGFSLCASCGRWSPGDDHYGPDAKCGMKVDHFLDRISLMTEGVHDALLIDILAPSGEDAEKVAISLAYALQGAIGVTYGLDESELSGEVYPLPDGREDGRRILIYETDEGGVGALSAMAAHPGAWRRVTRATLELLHESVDGEADDRACVDSCYECLRSFYNQWHHDFLDRRSVLPILKAWLDVGFEIQIDEASWDNVISEFDSETEKKMVEAIKRAGIRAPDAAHLPVPKGGPHLLSADLWYEGEQLAVLLDGGVHNEGNVAITDEKKRSEYRSLGERLLVIRDSELDEGIKSLRQRLE